jgi:D-alanine-D-alanine ligase
VVTRAFDARPETAQARVLDARPTIVFNLVESVHGEGRLAHRAPELLEALALPFTGAGARAMRASSSKLASKELLRAADLPTPAWLAFDELQAGHSLREPGRWIVKSVWEHGSLGLEADAVVNAAAPEELAAAIEARRSGLGGEAFAERYVHGRELNVSILAGREGPECLPIPEILFEGLASDEARIVGYRAKWAPDSPECRGTPRRFGEETEDDLLHAKLRELALATWRAFGLEGWARVDFRVGADGQPQVIDVNANPCLSPDAGFSASVEKAGIGYPDALTRIVAAGMARGRRPGTRGLSHSSDRR